MDQEDGKDNDTDLTQVSTVAGRAPAPRVPKPGSDEAPTGSPGAGADRARAKEQAEPRGNTGDTADKA